MTTFQFINAGLIQVTSSFISSPLSYPTFTGSILVTGGELTASNGLGFTPPYSMSLLPNTYSVSNDNQAANNWCFITDTLGNIHPYSGSILSSSTLVNFGTIEDSNQVLRSNTQVDIVPQYLGNTYLSSSNNNNAMSFVTQDRLTFYSNLSGSLSCSLVSPAYYQVTLYGNVRNTPFTIYATGSSAFVGNILAVPISNTGAPVSFNNPAQFAYTINQTNFLLSQITCECTSSFALIVCE